ncbi:hypothetical protein QBC37DRAFT_170676 [Rhypophila decipiens]|uniref:MutL C-terminal dimerisation domain-containing protein n=1 Tax=Rhypophila decipiens TaxID=261697 RepID=A0AAN6YBJ5_9PEZI|nr:hypothetical protein QBC37DRAFT_170676 [Rhypophila decipiens]
MSIQPLPGDVVAQIKSSIIITSLNGVVSGLLQNSLDARASRINVSVDYARGNCSVEDDGLGILPASFHESGGLGQLYYTSRYPPRAEYHGRHGEFLASLGTLSLLTVASHHHEYRSHNCLTIHNSRVISRNVPALPEQRVVTFPTGTRVAVRDLFGSMPVRVKQRAMEMERLGSTRSFNQLVSMAVALLLAWPTGVVVSLQDVTSNRTIVLRTSTLGRSPTQMAREIPARTCTLLGQASLLEREDAKSWLSIGASVTGVSLGGCVCLVPVATRSVQFISLGIQPLSNENQSNILYEEVNKVFANSRFGEVEEVELGQDGVPKKTEGFTAKELKPKRGLDRWPMFFIQIMLDEQMESFNTDGLIDDSNHNLTMITDLLQVMVYEFLKKHHFHPRAVNALGRLQQPRSGTSKVVHSPSHTSALTGSVKQSRKSSSRPPASGSSTLRSLSRSQPRGISKTSSGSSRSLPRGISRTSSASPFGSWAQIKPDSTSSSSSKTIRRTSDHESPNKNVSQHFQPLFNKSGQLVRKPFADVEEDKHDSSAQKSSSDPIVWVDPATKLRALIDPRTGFEIKPKKPPSKAPESHDSVRSDTTSLLDLFKQQKIPPARKEARAFEPVEPPIPRVPELAGVFGQGSDNSKTSCNHAGGELGNINLELPRWGGAGGASTTTTLGRISKDALKTAEIIGQVDKKFILVKVSSPNSKNSSSSERNLLVLIDQHAADERCRVEDLMRQYFDDVSGDDGKVLVARTLTVSKPLVFELSAREGKLLVRFQKHFEHWGVWFEVVFAGHHPADDANTAKVEIWSLPGAIIERCRLEPRLLVDLVRKEVWRLNDSPGLGSSGTSERVAGQDENETESGWVARFHQCPEGILEMVNSRACRSAIMFNDVLTQEQCVDLVQRLARCAFPFQCAHGRPSMVPIVDLGGAGTVQDGIGSLGGLFGGHHHQRSRTEKGGSLALLGDLKSWADEKGEGSV